MQMRPSTRARAARGVPASAPVKLVAPPPKPQSGARPNKRPRAADAAAADGASPRAADAAAADGAWFDSLMSGVDEEYRQYMRTEWGFPKLGETPLFEKLCLEGAQAGLSWATILKKREAYRAAFHRFDVDACAAMGAAEVDALLASSKTGAGAIVRHRGKIESVISNARAVQALRSEWSLTNSHCASALDDFLWSHVGHAPVVTTVTDPRDLPTVTPVAERLSAALKKRGFKFVGPTMVYSLMQSCGLVLDHPVGTPEHTAAKAAWEQVVRARGA